MVRKQHSAREIGLWLAAALLVFAVLTFYLWHLNENIRLGWDTSKRESEKQSLREEVKKLETRKSELLALERVERIARADLGLTDPRDDQFVYEVR
jgi:cell division protein FtsL